MVIYSIGWSVACALQRAAYTHGAGAAELGAIERLEQARGAPVDVERLAPLAMLAELPWAELFPYCPDCGSFEYNGTETCCLRCSLIAARDLERGA